MPEIFLNHNEENNPLFGLLPARLVNFAKQEKPKGAPPKGELEKAYEGAEKATKEFEKYQKDIIKKIEEYNKDTLAKPNKEREPYKERLMTDLDNVDEVIEQIDRILTTPYKYEGKWYTLTNIDPDGTTKGRAERLLAIRNLLTSRNELTVDGKEVFIDENFIEQNWNSHFPGNRDAQIDLDHLPDIGAIPESQIDQFSGIAGRMKMILKLYENESFYDELLAVYNQVLLQLRLLKATPEKTAYENMAAKYQEALESRAHAHGERLVKRVGRMMEMLDEKISWEKTPAFDHIDTAFEMATTEPVISAGSDEFQRFWTYPGYGTSNAKMDESRNLFFSIMAQETARGSVTDFEAKQFKIDFVLGPEFQNDPEENRKRFPYIYNQWIEHHGIDLKKVEAQNAKVNAVKNEIILGNIPTIDSIIDTANATPLQVGLDRNGIAGIPKEPLREHFEEKIGALTGYIHQLNKIAGSKDKLADRKALDKLKKDLQVHQKLAEAEYDRTSAYKRADEVFVEFTRAELSHPDNTQLVTELAMRKFREAMKLVDSPFKYGNFGDNCHPAVRRLLIAQTYKMGVSEFRVDFGTGEESYVENLSMDSKWMLNAFGSSEYYNRHVKGEAMDKEARALLPLARLANKAYVDLQNFKTIKENMRLCANYIKNPTTANKNKLSKVPSGMLKVFLGKPADVLEAKIQEIETQKEPIFKQFTDAVAAALQNPYSDVAKKLKEDVAKGVVYKDIIKPKDMEEIEMWLKQVELNYNTMEVKEKSRKQFFEKIGINIKGVYNAYKIEMGKLPKSEQFSMSIHNWDNLRISQNPEDFAKLTGLLEKILGHNDTQGAKDFLEVFKTMHGDVPLGQNEETLNDQATAVDIFEMIKEEIMEREKANAVSAEVQKEMKALIEGETIGDKATRYAKSVVNMLLGPGQSWANRGAGLIIIIAALKAAKKAYKGEDKMGKALRVLFMAGAAELAVKHVTGRGLLERMGLASVANAAEGTFEAVLVLDGQEGPGEYMESNGITPEQHTAALYELNRVPFHEVMAWYNDENINKYNGGMIDENKDDTFPDGINLHNIIKGETWKGRDDELAARKVVMHTVKHFFQYVGAKEGRSPEDTAFRLNERWVKMREDPNYKCQHTEDIHLELLKEYRKKPDELTWQLVTHAEIDLADVEATKGRTGATPIIEYFKEKGTELLRWTRQDLYGTLSGRARIFFSEFVPDVADKVKDFIGEMGEAGATKLHFAKESAYFWWQDKKVEVRRFLGTNFELIVEGIKLPFEVIYGANKAIVPWVLSKLKQGKEIMRSGSDLMKVIPEGREFSLADIVGPKVLYASPYNRDQQGRGEMRREMDRLMAGGATMEGAVEQLRQTNPQLVQSATERVLTSPKRYEKDKNPDFTFFGLYQLPFYEAFARGETYTDMTTGDTRRNNMYFETPMESNIYPDTGVGYLVTETTQGDANISPEDTGKDTEDRYHIMEAKAREDAIRYYRGEHPNLTLKQVERFMYPIHMTAKAGKTPPEKIYVFWRMPLPGSPEFELKDSGHWADYLDPNRHKDRPPFMVDPSKGVLDNMKTAAALNTRTTREVLGMMGSVASQFTRAAMGAGEAAGDVIQWGGSFFTDEENLAIIDTITERSQAFQEAHDEWFTSADSTITAKSDFYHVRENARMFKALRQYAIDKQRPVYLGPLNEDGVEVQKQVKNPDGSITTEMRGRESQLYNDPWHDWNPEEWVAYYQEWQEDPRNR